jgi:hypothetical protein
MKNIKLSVLLLFVTVLLSSCVSVVEIYDQWEGQEFNDKANQKVLVVYKTDDAYGKKRFEKDLAEKLRNSGVTAIESYIVFPNAEHKKRTEAEVDELIDLIKKEGFTSVVVSGIKNKIELSETSTVGGYEKEMYTSAGHNNNNYYGFGSFFATINNYSNVGSIYIEAETTENSYNVYTLESVTYNLSLEKKAQVVGVLTVKVTDPASYEEIAGKYMKMIIKHFNKI